MSKITILVVEDEAITAKDLQLRLKHMGYEVPYIAATGEEAINKAREVNPDLLLMDIMLADNIDGIEAARQIRLTRDVPVIYLSAYTDGMLAERAKDTEPLGYLSKPFSDYDLHNTVEMALYKHRIDRKLREEKEFNEKAIDAQIDTFFVFNPETGKAVRWNKRFREVSGYTDEEIADMKAPDDFFSSEDLKRAAAVINDVIKIGHGRTELSLICKDGRRVPTEYLASIFTDEAKKVRYIISIGRDMTERKLYEEKLLKISREWETTFDAISDPVSIHDKDFRLVKVNKAFCDLLKKPAEELRGRKCYEVLHGSHEPWHNCPHKGVMEHKKPFVEEFFEPHLGLHVQVSASPILDKDGEVTGSVHIIKDVSGRVKGEGK